MVKRFNIYALGIPEREERDNGAETISKEIITRSFMKVMKDIKLWAQEAPRTSSRINTKKTHISRLLGVKWPETKTKRKILKAAEEGKIYVTFKQTSVRSTAGFSPEMMKARRQCKAIFKVLRENNC